MQLKQLLSHGQKADNNAQSAHRHNTAEFAPRKGLRGLHP